MKINFITPTSKRGGYANRATSDCYAVLGIKTKQRKNKYIAFNLKNFLNKYKLGWEYAAVGFTDDGRIVLMQGNKNTGYFISKQNKDLSNEDLLLQVFSFCNTRMPDAKTDLVKINFTSVYDAENSVYILTKQN